MSEQKAAYAANTALTDQELEADYQEDAGDMNDYDAHAHNWQSDISVIYDFIYRCYCGAVMTPGDVKNILDRVCQDRYSGFGKLVDWRGEPLDL